MIAHTLLALKTILCTVMVDLSQCFLVLIFFELVTEGTLVAFVGKSLYLVEMYCHFFYRFIPRGSCDL